MSFNVRARRSAQKRVRHFGGGLVVLVEKVTLKRSAMASTQAAEIDPANVYADVPALEVEATVADKAGAQHRQRGLTIAGADMPGADLLQGRWRVTPTGGAAFIVPGPILMEGPASSPIAWRFNRAEGAQA